MQNVGRHSVPWIYKASQKLKFNTERKTNRQRQLIIQNASAFSLIMHYAFYILHCFVLRLSLTECLFSLKILIIHPRCFGAWEFYEITFCISKKPEPV